LSNDEELFTAYVAGDATAFDRIYERHKAGTFRYLLRHVRNQAVAEELHQDVWLRAIRARETYGAESRFATWLYAIARNRLIDHWRGSRHERHVSLDDDADDSARAVADALPGPEALEPYALSVRTENLQMLQSALSQLPAAQRDAFLLHVEGGLSIAEIASLTDSGGETVKSRLRYAYARLRSALEAAR
jgi:RNA polymerase sigma factor (sigma-70 family)